MDYIWGFSWKGLVVFLLVMVPNLFYFLRPDSSGSGRTERKHAVLTIIEHGSQAIFVVLLVFLTSDQKSPLLSPYLIGMAIFLFFYYAMWVFYYRGRTHLPLLLGMAVFPVVYFILAELWLHLVPALVPTVIFGIAHITITCIEHHSARN